MIDMYFSSIIAKIKSLKKTIERKAVKRLWMNTHKDMWKIVDKLSMMPCAPMQRMDTLQGVEGWRGAKRRVRIVRVLYMCGGVNFETGIGRACQNVAAFVTNEINLSS